MDNVCGISINGTEVLFACKHGDPICVITVKDENGDSCLQLCGYGNIGQRFYGNDSFHGCMAMCGNTAIMANEGFPNAHGCLRFKEIRTMRSLLIDAKVHRVKFMSALV